MTIKYLIHKLKELESNEEVKQFLLIDPIDNSKYFDEKINFFKSNASKELLNLVYEVIKFLSKDLILWSGLNNYENIEILREAGFEITPGESDSQGPTSMIIHLKDFKISYA